MAIITDATLTWSDPVTLGADEIWQSRDNTLYITTTATPDADDGVSLRRNEALHLSAGTVLRYRKSGADAVTFVREVV